MLRKIDGWKFLFHLGNHLHQQCNANEFLHKKAMENHLY
jgi:hypothetical protein